MRVTMSTSSSRRKSKTVRDSPPARPRAMLTRGRERHVMRPGHRERPTECGARTAQGQGSETAREASEPFETFVALSS
jgi:hypothetical protein